MARKGRRRNQSPMMTRVPQRRQGGTFDWITSSNGVDATGSPITVNGWGGQSNVINASSITAQAVLIQPAPATSTPGIGRLRIDEIRGRINFLPWVLPPAANSFFRVAVGIYVSDLNNTTTLWNVRSLLTPAEAARDDYLFLEAMTFTAGAGADGVLALEAPFIDLHLSQPVVIGGGQALNVTVSCSSTIATGVEADFYFRTRVGPVA